MLDVHIDDFFKDCAVILLHGFKYFPAKQVLYVEDICGPDDADEFGLHSPRHLAAFGAIIWLQEEGYIRFTEVDRQESVDDFVLASKAFTRLLHADSEDPTTSLAQKIEFVRLQNDSTSLAHLMREHFLLR
ncbi:hypothetical protein A9R00_10465 [Oleispira antarctica]|uniref:Uncharacterized protein n=1 Tax=Oleispira antarctica TaxID=188908 RepID=A0A1Y5HTN4_OLEAN|nr:hypothetical protein A9R00_10465 [Oleispira antarctica]